MTRKHAVQEALKLTGGMALLSSCVRTLARRLMMPVVLAVLVVAPAVVRGDIIIPLNPTATYLRTHQDVVSHNATAYSLASLGFSPGQSISFTELGSYNDGNDTTPHASRHTDLIAVFSATNQLINGTTPGDRGDVTVQNRVSGAIGVGGLNAVTTPPTFNGSLPTNIDQDFYISPLSSRSPGSSVTLVIPTGAAYVFFSPDDSLFFDNTTSTSIGFGLYGVDIAAVPEPSSVLLLVMGVGGIAVYLGLCKRKTSLSGP